MSFKELRAILLNGILNENPTFRLVLGMCPTLAITYQASNGIGMGLATTFVLVFSNLVISLLRNLIPEKIRIPSFIIIIATFVTIVEMVMHAFVPDLYDTLGVFISLIVVNCIIFARAESFAFKNPPLPSIMDGLGMGLGFTLAITLLSCIRELLGSGTIFGSQIMPEWFEPMGIVIQPAGGFIILGLLLATVTGLSARAQRRKEAAK
ncbi:MAG TPA: electron transport complex subunit E [Candidatus Pullichristensenella excrementigallinarum]|uniref:Ion-translocating oxidoreductase complex subunit E n=1 Tax=Candidatus Pullichristensenella excrementigallinarum TaxID=2840907 RepID=A0A9D1IAS5_9FIRM|nr:electron transport complex subunit E [Candidatus Pullichristensenella excrementigallinarum]